MCFHFDYQTSTEDEWLAKRYLGFLKLETNSRVPGQSEYLSSWAVMFDSLLKTHSLKAVKAVLKYYIQTVKEDYAFLHVQPESFREAFPVLYRRLRRIFNPVPESELEPLMKEFNECRWGCDDRVLKATIGQSLWSLRRFRQEMAKSGLSKAKIDYLEDWMGSNFDYIRKKLLPPKPWLWNKTYRLQKPITYDALCAEVSEQLRLYGADAPTIKGFLDAMRGDRPR